MRQIEEKCMVEDCIKSDMYMILKRIKQLP